MKYLRKYTESINYRKTSDINQIIDDIDDILTEIKDLGYLVSIDFFNEYEKIPWKFDPGINITIANSDDYINLKSISDTIIRLYDYMKTHQIYFKRTPSRACIFDINCGYGYVSGRRETIGWAQLDNRYESYNLLRDKEFYGLIIKYNKK